MIHEHVSPKKLALVRIVLFSALAGYALSVPGERLSLLPPGVHEGVGLTAFFPALLDGRVMLGLRAVAALLLGAAAAGVRPFRPIACLGMLLFTVFVALLHPGHREAGALYLGYALALGPSAEALSVGGFSAAKRPAPPELFSLTLVVASFVFLLTYAMTGVQRLLDGSPEAFFDHSMVWHIASNSERNGSFGFSYGFAFLRSVPGARVLLDAGFLLSTYLEALAPFALFWTNFRRVFVLFALGFHLSNLLLMNIEFGLSMLVALLLLVAWEAPGERAAPLVVSERTSRRVA